MVEWHLSAGQFSIAGWQDTRDTIHSRLEEDGGAKNRIDTLARVTTALNHHLVSFPQKLPAKVEEAVQVA